MLEKTYLRYLFSNLLFSQDNPTGVLIEFQKSPSTSCLPQNNVHNLSSFVVILRTRIWIAIALDDFPKPLIPAVPRDTLASALQNVILRVALGVMMTGNVWRLL